jgi:hypothetical protein
MPEANPENPVTGGGDPAPTPKPETANPTGVVLTPAEYKALLEDRNKLAAKEAEAQAAAKLAEEARIAKLAADGKWQEALNKSAEAKDAEIAQFKGRAEQLLSERLTDKKEVAISAALAGVQWANEFAMSDARAVLDSRFEAVRDDAGTISVVDKATRRPAADVVKEWINSPASAHYRAPSTTGGSGSKGGDRSAPAVNEDQLMKPIDALIEVERLRRAQGNGNPYAPLRRN